MKTAVIGSRSFEDYERLKKELDGRNITMIISGGARGADTLAERYAKQKGIEIRVFNPDYKKDGRAAPFVRNRQIVEACDAIVAFWDGKEGGTKYTIDYAGRKNKKVTVVSV